MGALADLKTRLVELKRAPGEVAKAAAPRIEAKFRQDATTKRGNLPSYGERGEVPIVAKARPQAILVTGPDWCVEKAIEKGEVDSWVDIITDEAAKIMAGER